MMTTPGAIKHLTQQLKKDSSYRESWKSTIAMAYKDNWQWYANKAGKKQMNRNDRHIIANNAAEYFLKLLCNEF